MLIKLFRLYRIIFAVGTKKMLVLFTGGRGSGKSTVARALYEALDADCVDYVNQSSWRLFANNIFKKIFFIFYFLTFFRLKICLVYF